MIDRRVRIVGEKSGTEAGVYRISALRHHRAIVILGEPGIGKTELLKSEAAHDGVAPIGARVAAAGLLPRGDQPLYLDALDEYRADGSPADKMLGVAKLLRDLAPPRWRLACRSEDWRASSDLAAIDQAGDDKPVVVQVLPLDAGEAVEVLVSFGLADPHAFMAEARRVGAGGLLENPLSLRLLHKVVGLGGDLPTTRFDLFAKACGQYVLEHNPIHQERRGRSSPSETAAAADRIALVTLATGSRGVSRSTGTLPDGLIAVDRLGGRPDVVDDALDTPLFVCVGDGFELMHRSVAEFLGGRALAAAVAGGIDRAALPLGRALALISGPNGRVPSELRGLHAWFAAHLAHGGDAVRAGELVDRDAIGILAYGDAAAFDLATRRRLFDRLDQNDPYFLATTTLGDTTILGGLASSDMASSFLSVLSAPAATHKLAAVFDILEHGRPVEEVRPRLRALALDRDRPEWQRGRAIDAWLAGAPDVAGARAELLAALAAEPSSLQAETLRAKLLSALPPGELSPGAVKDLLAAYILTDRDNMVMRLYPLRRRLQREPMPALFDVPLRDWLDEDRRRQSIEVGGVLDAALAAVIASLGDDADQLWRIVLNAREGPWDTLDEQATTALRGWLAKEAGRPARLFDAIVATLAPGDHPGDAAAFYEQLVGGEVDRSIVPHLVERLGSDTPSDRDGRLAAVLVELARRRGTSPAAYFAVLALLGEGGPAELRQRLQATPLEEHHLGRMSRNREQAAQRGEARARLVAGLRPRAEGLRTGDDIDLLDQVAENLYLRQSPADQATTGEGRVAERADDEIAAAALAGFDVVAGRDSPADPYALGAAEARRERFPFELPMLVGLLRKAAGR